MKLQLPNESLNYKNGSPLYPYCLPFFPLYALSLGYGCSG